MPNRATEVNVQPYPCEWRLHGVRAGGVPAAPWERGRLFTFMDVAGRVCAIVATEKGSLLCCELDNVKVGVLRVPESERRW